jgi:hypothetical protein
MLPRPQDDDTTTKPFTTVLHGYGYTMLFDILIAIIIVAIAAVLGLVVHPLLWLIVIVAVLWLFGRYRMRV